MYACRHAQMGLSPNKHLIDAYAIWRSIVQAFSCTKEEFFSCFLPVSPMIPCRIKSGFGLGAF